MTDGGSSPLLVLPKFCGVTGVYTMVSFAVLEGWGMLGSGAEAGVLLAAGPGASSSGTGALAVSGAAAVGMTAGGSAVAGADVIDAAEVGADSAFTVGSGGTPCNSGKMAPRLSHDTRRWFTASSMHFSAGVGNLNWMLLTCTAFSHPCISTSPSSNAPKTFRTAAAEAFKAVPALTTPTRGASSNDIRNQV